MLRRTMTETVQGYQASTTSGGYPTFPAPPETEIQRCSTRAPMRWEANKYHLVPCKSRRAHYENPPRQPQVGTNGPTRVFPTSPRRFLPILSSPQQCSNGGDLKRGRTHSVQSNGIERWERVNDAQRASASMIDLGRYNGRRHSKNGLGAWLTSLGMPKSVFDVSFNLTVVRQVGNKVKGA